ncbi:MAG: PD-(D/E)XK nuclease family protein [Rickettsiales bacterium]|nr:PD-(D/E)XK nuclease family protein [Rickettsiales bacterium]
MLNTIENKMNSGSKTNIFNIPSNYHFFECFYYWLLEKFSNQVSQAIIFLPNQRSCRELRQLFLQKTLPDSAIILPKIKAISDLSYEDFFDFLPNIEVEEIIDEILQIKVISGIDSLLFLAQEIQKIDLFGKNISTAQALDIATNLQDLFDEIEREEIDLKKIYEIDNSDLSAHRQITLQFLQDFYLHLKNLLIKKNILFAASYQNFIVKKFINALESFGSKFPIIIAGSTGSISSSKKLIKAINNQQNGYVILYGLDQKSEIFDQENHPQFFLNQLINFLEIDKKTIKNFYQKNFCLNDKSRLELLKLAMLPTSEIKKWQEDKIEATTENIKIINTIDEFQEAKIIGLIAAESFYENKKIAIITNNQKLAKLVKYQLKELELPFNDSRNLGVFSSQLINFILLIFDLIESDFSSANLLAVLQNPLCKINNKNKILTDFENKVLRQDRKEAGLEGIKDKLESLKIIELEIFFSNFYQKLTPLTSLKSQLDIASFSQAVIEVLQKLSEKSFFELLAAEDCYEELLQFFNTIKTRDDFLIDPKNALTTFRILFSQISFFEKSDANSAIQILSTIEARLLNYDLVIIASLNEGIFPALEAENWLGKKIKKDLGIDKKLKKVGQNAYDFCNYLCNKEVVLIRSENNDNNISSPSPFLLKLQTLGKKLKINFANGNKYFIWLETLNQVKPFKIEAPQPKPKIAFRPKKLAITDISKLIANPYTIYARKILKLYQLQKIDFEPSYAEFGSFIHKALEEFVKKPQNLETSLKISYKIFEKYFISNEARLIWWPKFENIFTNFFILEQELKITQNLVELNLELSFEKVLISGKIDRVAFNWNNLTDIFVDIYDYKTGQIPTKEDVICGKQPQLTIAALMLLEGLYKKNDSFSFLNRASDIKISSLNYWQINLAAISEIKKISNDIEEIKMLIAAAKNGLTKLFQYFANENNAYIATANSEKSYQSEYSHLARNKEWQ